MQKHVENVTWKNNTRHDIVLCARTHSRARAHTHKLSLINELLGLWYAFKCVYVLHTRKGSIFLNVTVVQKVRHVGYGTFRNQISTAHVMNI